MTAEERFRCKVQAGSPSECWEWQGQKYKGYGRIKVQGRTWRAHRLAFVLANGAIPDDAVVRHTCDNPGCVNPAHLVSGTQLENIQDRVERTGQYNFKLTPELTAAIRQARGRGLTWDELQTKFKVGRTTVGRALGGEY